VSFCRNPTGTLVILSSSSSLKWNSSNSHAIAVRASLDHACGLYEIMSRPPQGNATYARPDVAARLIPRMLTAWLTFSSKHKARTKEKIL
jgi:hypothetical protein